MVGNTELGIEVKFKHFEYPVYINPSMVCDLTEIKIDDAGITLGASVTLSEIEKTCGELLKSMPGERVKVLQQMMEMLQCFAGKYIQ